MPPPSDSAMAAESAEWLMETAGPIVRYRTARDLLDRRGDDVEPLRREALACDEAQRWIGLLDGSNRLHGAEDAFLENILLKLGLYGLTVDIPEIADKIEPFVDRHGGSLGREAMILLSCLASVGHTDDTVEALAHERADLLAASAEDQVFDFLKSDAQKSAYSPKWRSKPICRDELADRIPWVYDLLACAFYRDLYPSLARKLESIAAYILDERFQRHPATLYLAAPGRKYCHSVPSPRLPCHAADGKPEDDFALDRYSRPRLLLYLFIMAHFDCTFESAWYRRIMDHLSKFRTERGTYEFPSDYLNERADGYFLYAGAHMGLGENRRRRVWREVESTFWMLWFGQREQGVR